MTTLLGILRGCGCKLRDGYVLMTPCARVVLVAAGQRTALDCEDGVWLEVVS